MVRRLQVIGVLAMSGAFMAGTGCAGHRVPHAASDESRPHISWEIRTGGDLGDDRLVCGTLRPEVKCVLGAGTQDRPNRITIHVYLHATDELTNYVGTMTTPFLTGSKVLSTRDVSASVPKGSRPVGSTVSGVVTSSPGSYRFGISLDAVEVGSRTAVRIVQEADVVVN